MGAAGPRSLKYGKIAIVLFLTALIWVWADLELDETPPERPAVIEVDESSSETVWVSFRQKPSADIKVTLTGPHSAFVALDRPLRSAGRRLTFVFDAEQERMSEPGGHSLEMLAFLQKDKALKDLGLKVKSCVPEFIDVNVVALTKKSLPVECFREDGQSVEAESIEPSTVEMFVPEGTRTARVRLSDVEIEQARSVAKEKTPYIVLAEGLIKYAGAPVRIMIPPATDPLSEETITAPKLGMALSANLQGKYSVEVTNLNEVIGPIQVRSTATAKQAYESMRYQMILEIDDEDVKQAEPRRQVKYNFPEDFVRADQIKINQPPVQARFKLKPISPPPETP